MTHTHNTETKDDDLYSDLKLSFHTAYNENDGEGNLKSHKQTKLSITCSDRLTYFLYTLKFKASLQIQISSNNIDKNILA